MSDNVIMNRHKYENTSNRVVTIVASYFTWIACRNMSSWLQSWLIWL